MNVLCWGYLKDKACHQNSQTTAELEQHISAASENISAVAFARASANSVLILYHVVTEHRGYVENIVIKFFMTFLATYLYSFFKVFPLISAIYFQTL